MSRLFRGAWLVLLTAGCASSVPPAPAVLPPPAPPARAQAPVPVVVTGTLVCEALGRAPRDVSVFIARLSDGALVSHSAWNSGRFNVRLLPGKYRILCKGVEIARQEQQVEVPAGQAAFDLGSFELEPSAIAVCYGKPPPDWRVAEARGVDPKCTLADFKGRWTVLEFWGYW